MVPRTTRSSPSIPRFASTPDRTRCPAHGGPLPAIKTQRTPYRHFGSWHTGHELVPRPPSPQLRSSNVRGARPFWPAPVSAIATDAASAFDLPCITRRACATPYNSDAPTFRLRRHRPSYACEVSPIRCGKSLIRCRSIANCARRNSKEPAGPLPARWRRNQPGGNWPVMPMP